MNIENENISSQSTPITWMDVARALAQLEPSSEMWTSRPGTLLRAEIDWTGAVFEFSNAPQTEEFERWLRAIFPKRINLVEGQLQILLEGPSSSLPVNLEVRQPGHSLGRPPPLGSIETSIEFSARDFPATAASLPLIACHSVKGGNGRTTVAITAALIWAEQAKRPVLIVDADLEAPGLSYLYRRERGVAEVAFEDVVALAHSDESLQRQETITFVASKLRGQKAGELYILPLRRHLDELASSSLRAEHLASSDEPFVLAKLLRDIATTLGCAGVVIDIRAGLAPIAAQLMLDSSIDKIFVTSLAGQSLDGTVSLLKYLARESRRRRLAFGKPLIVINRIPSVLRETGTDEGLIRPVLDDITYELLKGDSDETSANDVIYEKEKDIQPISVVRVPEISDLQVSSAGWEGFVSQLVASGFYKRLAGQLIDWLDQTVVPPEDGTPIATSGAPAPMAISHKQACNKLKLFAGQLVSAEGATSPIDTPLITGPLRQLAERFVTQLPIVVSEGAKGTGKTLTARFLVSKSTWQNAVNILSSEKSVIDAHILPVIGSIQASEAFQNEIDASRAAVAKSLGFDVPQPVHETKVYLTSNLNNAGSEQERSTVWMNAIAWSAGFEVGSPDAGERLALRLKESGQRLLAVVEGVEELYSNPFQGSAPEWLRSLVVDLPQRLRGEPGRPLGLIVFVRRDSVDAAVPQNSDQFRRMYQPFALSWSDADVLELAAWLATKSGALAIWEPTVFRDKPRHEQEAALWPLWGRKLGPDDRPTKRTAEAYTANWVVAVLSDLQSRLVARDLIRFLESAAGFSADLAEADYASSRLLSPRALKDAIKPTSIAKVAETQEEIAELGPVFDKFRRHPDRVIAPIDEAAALTLGLSPADIVLLQRHAILFGDVPPYEVPELFRMGLNLKHGGARHSVINLRRRARQRQGLPL